MKLATLCYIINGKNDSVLMLHRVKKDNDYHKGKWNGLGGKFKAGETPEECVIREVEEESGLKIINPKMHGFITFPLFDNSDDWYVFLFSASEYKGKLIDSSEGNLQWIPKEKLFDLNLWEGDKIFMKWIFQEKFFSAKFNYTNGKYIDYDVKFY